MNNNSELPMTNNQFPMGTGHANQLVIGNWLLVIAVQSTPHR